MASAAADASSRPLRHRQFGGPATLVRLRDVLERWLEAERDSLPLWIPVAIGAGISLWFVLPDPRAWTIAGLLFAAVALAAIAGGQGGRAARAVAIAAALALVGLTLIWWRADHVRGAVLGGPVVATFEARVEGIEPLPARELVRLTLAPLGLARDSKGAAVALPRRVRVNLAETDLPPGLGRSGVVSLQARLMPPPSPGVPGAYDFARVAWFSGIGATGRGSAPVTVNQQGRGDLDLRHRLTTLITTRLPGSAGGIAAALATGDEGAIALADADAMRSAGLAHLLSVSGLHITAVVGATMLVVLRLLALSRWLAHRTRLPLIAALAGAAAAIGYTLLTGSQVPTIRSCVAALLVLGALALGREAMTLRLVATGATAVLLVRPESLAGPSFQLSFAAITSIIGFHEHPRIKQLFGPHDEDGFARLFRGGASLLLTGLMVEAALMPIAVYHFHQAGMYGALANIVAIPLTTFVVMPLVAAALVLDGMGFGWPFWWLAGQALAALLWIAHRVAEAPGAVAALPAMPGGAFALMVAGGLWLALWRTRVRRWGAVPLVAGALWALATPPPDLLVTGDGRHLALRTSGGGFALLRDRAGDYTRDMLAENGGGRDQVSALSELSGARCSRDLCLAELRAGDRYWRVLATRSAYMVSTSDLIAACRAADVVVSDRRLPRACSPRWLKLDRPVLARTGGVAVTLSSGRIVTVQQPGDAHPWRAPPRLPVSRSGAECPKAYPGYAPARAHNAGDHKRGWPDRAGPSPLRDGNI